MVTTPLRPDGPLYRPRYESQRLTQMLRENGHAIFAETPRHGMLGSTVECLHVIVAGPVVPRHEEVKGSGGIGTTLQQRRLRSARAGHFQTRRLPA